jgi:hypothetical protein
MNILKAFLSFGDITDLWQWANANRWSWRETNILVYFPYFILPASLGPGVYLASNRNEYQKHKNNNVSGE